MATFLLAIAFLAASIGIAFLYLQVVGNSPIHEPVPLDWPSPEKFPSYAVQTVERIAEGDVLGPEDLALDMTGKFMYAACADGWIRKVSLENGKAENWTYVGGRPLGIFTGLQSGQVLVCEPELGLLNVTKENVEILSGEAGGLKYKLADGLDVAKDGTVYFTDASTAFKLHDFDLDFAEGRPYGRLLKYSPETRKTVVLLDGLYFPNGLALSKEEDFIVFCETTKYDQIYHFRVPADLPVTSRVRLQRYWLQGEKQGKLEVLLDNLPGLPDNVHRYGDVFWVALLGGRAPFLEMALGSPFVKHLTARWRLFRKFVSNAHPRLLVITEDGKPLKLYQANSMEFVTSVIRVHNDLYLGSLTANYIGKIRLSD